MSEQGAYEFLRVAGGYGRRRNVELNGRRDRKNADKRVSIAGAHLSVAAWSLVNPAVVTAHRPRDFDPLRGPL